VLHHLADPDAGLRALRSVLKPEGAIDLMVYARYGRTGISMLQDYCLHHDLIVAITEDGKRMFDAIDGRRTIAEIASNRDAMPHARTLFQTLWWYDQVVFATNETGSE
jgi:2-polyprenyl-3-methyl-5-hydroxy-6-metoxy-1,4-benzoquinol methylase